MHLDNQIFFIDVECAHKMSHTLYKNGRMAGYLLKTFGKVRIFNLNYIEYNHKINYFRQMYALKFKHIPELSSYKNTVNEVSFCC